RVGYVGWQGSTGRLVLEAENGFTGWDIQNGDIGGKGTTPIGGGMDYWADALPPGWLWADGSAISRTTYARLFAKFGTKYGAGDGSTTFNLPDKRARLSLPRDNLGATGAAGRVDIGTTGINTQAVGASGGDQRAQAHSHGVTDT